MNKDFHSKEDMSLYLDEVVIIVVKKDVIIS
jgi:hypothetical protein